MTENALRAAAERIARARTHRERQGPLPESERPRTEADAYAVQDAVHETLARAGRGALAGYKIGCTTPVMQAFLRIGNPCAGGVLAPTVIEEPGVVAFDDYLHVGVECELAVRLATDLPAAPDAAAHDRESVAASVGAVMAAIEIVDDRWDDYRSVDTPSLIADDFFGAGCVLGAPREDWRSLDLAGLGGRMRINGDPVGEGVGRDILGHPLEALAWLARSLQGRGRTLRSGEIVLLGSLVQTVWLARGDRVSIEVDGLGGASVSFE